MPSIRRRKALRNTPGDDRPRASGRHLPERITAPRSRATRRWVRAQSAGLTFERYQDLWRWSVTISTRSGPRSSSIFERALRRVAVGRARQSRRCPALSGSRARAVNYAEHVFRGKADDAARDPARLRAARRWRRGRGASCARRRRAIAAGLRALGVGRGDRVAAYMPNIPETVAAFLACASIGAIWSSRGAGVRRAQRDRPVRADRAQGAAGDRRLPLRRQGLRPQREVVEEIAGRDPVARARGVGSATSTARGGRTGSSGSGSELEFAPVPFDHPLWVLYSSRARPGCPSRSSTARAGSCSSS